jgi:glucokinase
MYYIGVDLGGTNIAVGVVNDKFKIIKKGSVPTKAEREADEIIRDMADLALRLLGECSLSVADVEYAGISTPGTAVRETGVVVYANNLPFMNYPLAAKLSEMTGIKRVLIENDANAAAKAEAVAGAARGAKFSVMITLGTGVGGGIVIDGDIYSGFNSAGAELGHMVIEKDGRPCSCGRRGCWEAYSSATGLINLTKDKIAECREKGIETSMEELIEHDLSKTSGRTAFTAKKNGDKVGAEVVDEYIDYLACGLTNVVRIFHPDVLSIGGGIANERDNLLDPLKERVTEMMHMPDGFKLPELKIAEMGNDAGIIGAATLGM